MKTLNIFRKVFFVVGAAAVAVAAVLQAAMGDLTMATLTVSTGLSVLFVGVLLLILGLVLDSSKNEVAHKIGVGLHVAGIVMLVVYAIAWFISLPDPNKPAGYMDCIVILVGAVVYGLGWFMTLLMHASRRYECGACGAAKAIQPEEDAHIAAIMKWKKLYNEGIITEREFIDKRNEILGLRK